MTSTGINQLTFGTISGLETMALDELTAVNVTSTTMTCQNMSSNFFTNLNRIEAVNVTVDQELQLSDTGFITIGKGTVNQKTVTDTEIGYLDGVTSGIQAQIIEAGSTNAQVGTNTTAIGVNASAISANTTAIGVANSAISANTTAIGVANSAISANTTAIGVANSAISANTTAIGVANSAISANTTAIGVNASAISANTTAIGVSNSAIGVNASAITAIKQKTDPITMSSTAMSMARRIAFLDASAAQLGYIGAIASDMYCVSNAQFNFQSAGDTNIKATTTNFGFTSTSGSIVLRNGGMITIGGEQMTHAFTNADHTNVNYIPNMKLLTDSFETVTAGEIYTQKKLYFRAVLPAVNQAYIGLVGSGMFIGNTNFPINFNPGSSYVSNNCEYTYLGSGSAPGRIKLQSYTNAQGTVIGGSLIIKNESQNNAYTDVDHTAVGEIPTIIEDVDILLGRTTANETAINQLQSAAVPCGTVLITARPPTVAPPTGYLYCDGALVPKSIYAELWDLIGDTYRYTKPISPSFFYLPDLRQLYVRGSQQNTTYPVQALPSAGMGAYQGQSVMTHSHDYERPHITSDCGNYAPAPRTVWDDTTTPTKTTTLYDKDNVQIYPASAETRPESMTMNYMIKT